jgi:hypothetical protein
MATPLTKPIVRMIEHDGIAYKVVLSGDGVRITKKGGRRAISLSWDDLLSANEPPAEELAPGAVQEQSSPRLGMQDVVAADVLLLMRKANDTLAEATKLIDSASSLPSVIASHRRPLEPDDDERADWYIEPLLSIQQVSRILGVSTRKVRNLALGQIVVGDEIRYHPAELRRFMATQTSSRRPFR